MKHFRHPIQAPGGESEMTLTFVVTKGKDNGKVFRLDEGETKILGRSARADIVLHDEGVSRQHCRARLAGGKCCLVDLNSKNGTSVNGKRIAGEIVLAEGDLIDVGLTTLKVRLKTVGEPVPEPGTPSAEEPVLVAEVVEEGAEEAAISIAPVETVERPAASEASEESVMGAFERFLDLPPPRPEKGEPVGAPAFAIEAAPPPAPEEATPDHFLGRVIAGYRIEAFLGENDISRAYQALQLSMERRVCLKILSPELTGDHQAVHRFITGARSAGRLSHPNIVQVYDAGEEGGVNFIAIELVDGALLREELQRRGRNRPMDAAEALDLCEQIADALQYAHGQGVVHGNITPEAVYLAPHGVAKLANLGFTKGLAESGIERPSRFGERSRDLYFTAPEQLADPAAATPQSDVYALGAVLFVMLTGHMPFRGNSAQEVRDRVSQGLHEPLRRLRREAPVEVGALIDRALARDPRQRPAGAAGFLYALRRVRAKIS